MIQPDHNNYPRHTARVPLLTSQIKLEAYIRMGTTVATIPTLYLLERKGARLAYMALLITTFTAFKIYSSKRLFFLLDRPLASSTLLKVPRTTKQLG